MMPDDRLGVGWVCVMPCAEAAHVGATVFVETAVRMQPGMLTRRDLWGCPVEMSCSSQTRLGREEVRSGQGQEPVISFPF